MARYKKLRGVLYENELTQKDLARIVRKSESYVAVRMSGRYSFSLTDAYTILDYFDIPHDQMSIYFPLDGKVQPTELKQKGGVYHVPKQRIKTFTVTIAEDVKRDHAEGLLRILSRGDIAGYIEECRRECAVNTNSHMKKEKKTCQDH